MDDSSVSPLGILFLVAAERFGGVRQCTDPWRGGGVLYFSSAETTDGRVALVRPRTTASIAMELARARTQRDESVDAEHNMLGNVMRRGCERETRELTLASSMVAVLLLYCGC
jgi:hypothetical protein